MAHDSELTTPIEIGRRLARRARAIPRAQQTGVDSQTTIAATIVFWAIAIVGGTSPSTAALVKLGFAPAAFALGFRLWQSSPAGYLSFIWQLFFFSCLIRRLVDYQLGWDAMNPVIIAPYAAALWCGVTLLRPGRLFAGSFGLIVIGLLWAFAIGILNNGMSAAAFASLEWGVGPLIAGYLVTIRDESKQIQRWLFTTSLVSVIAMSVYGIVQEIWLPRWDQYWISSAGMASAVGLESGTIRVFSTMNSPWPFGMTIMALIVFLAGMRGRRGLRILAVIGGLAVLIASQTRAAWGGLVVGWFGLVLVARKTRGRLVGAAFLLIAAGGIATVLMPASSGLVSRLATLKSLGGDDSFAIRLQFYQSFFADALAQPIGAGLGRTGVATRLSADGSMLHFDSGLMNVPFVLGWIGALAYIAGLSELLLTVTRRRRWLSPTGLAAGAACVGLLAQMLFLNSLIAASGIMFWTFLGVCVQEVSEDYPAVAISRLKSLAGK